ncbi:MAG TPA: (4Fe-4S)-binding protein [Ohtaekwangia sp.]|uniref:(4Fe-4S)-binding protein n=1 Tax=Ohtaekwangia sp. TaxID=2066019 RepID=UPI002F95947B
MKDITKKYTNGEITIIWKPALCIHSTLCWKGLGEVFDPRKHPWITPEKSSTEAIIDQVKKCPSGALRYYYNAEKEDNNISQQ